MKAKETLSRHPKRARRVLREDWQLASWRIHEFIAAITCLAVAVLEVGGNRERRC